MQGLMMSFPLTTQAILQRAGTLFAAHPIVTRLGDGTRHQYSYGEWHLRVLRLMQALRNLGVQPGDRIATFCSNHHQHLELYFAVTSLGAVLHTLNIRLSPEQLNYIINHAEDQWIFVDASLAKNLETLQGEYAKTTGHVLIDGDIENCPLHKLHDYETLIGNAAPLAELPELDERQAAALCYTSGTTGNPKGALYDHRSIYLHAMGIAMADVLGLSMHDAVLPFVPMFHANGWGLPYAAPMTGAKLVLPGPGPTAADIAELIAAEQVTIAAGVPTIWNMLYQHLKSHPTDISALNTLVVGGSAAPRSMIEGFAKDFGVNILHVWGMTELSPLGTVCRLKPEISALDEKAQYQVRTKQGLPVACVEARVQSDSDQELPWDGESLGELQVRGPWIIREYYKNSEASKNFTADGWFRTGDMVNIDAAGYVQIADRNKDLIKSGGEWISSVDMENAIMAHEQVIEAAVAARADDKWDERPVAFVVTHPDASLTSEDIINHLAPGFARWQLPSPEDIRFIEEIPKTSVGKFDKKSLRARLTSGNSG